MTLMLAGHKTIVSNRLKFEFFPGTFFIPEQETINHVSIPNASIYNPTKCLVLELDPSYIQAIYEDVLHSQLNKDTLYQRPEGSADPYFLSNDEHLIHSLQRLYELQRRDQSVVKAMIEDLTIKEMLYRLFSTKAIHLLMKNFEKSIANQGIREVISYIKLNIQTKLSTAALAKRAGFGQTTFFKVFKQTTGCTPVEYILQERIRQAKILIQKGDSPLQEIAFRCGFNSYEYFCSSFKKIEQLKPSEFRKVQTVNSN
ncbi:MAG: helix-turn-helix domain-containing protein, partial [Bacteroidota bacterium]